MRSTGEPWFWTAKSVWCVEYQGKRIRGATPDEVKQKLSKLQRDERRDAAMRRVNSPVATFVTATIDQLAVDYLKHLKANRSDNHYRGMFSRIQRGLSFLDEGLLAKDVRKFHLRKIEQGMKDCLKVRKVKMVVDGKTVTREIVTKDPLYSTTTIADTIAAVQSIFAWAHQEEMCEFNPIVKYQKPARQERSRILTDEEFRTILRNTNAAFRRFLLAMRMTGCRPGELQNLRWDQLEQDNEGNWYIVLLKHKTITQQKQPKPRIIPLNAVMANLIRWIKRHSSGEYVFVNNAGTPYNKDTAGHLLRRAVHRAKISKVAGESLVLYSNRHTVATESLGKVSDTELAKYLGHTTTRTLMRYSHPTREQMLAIMRKIR